MRKLVRWAVTSLSLFLFAFDVSAFAEDAKVEQGKAAVVFSRIRTRQKTVTTTAPVVQVEKKEVKQTEAVKTATDACVNGACSVQPATTTTYQYRRTSPFRSNTSRPIFRSRTRASGSCASCGT